MNKLKKIISHSPFSSIQTTSQSFFCVRNIAYIYISIPTIIFLFFWLKPSIGITSTFLTFTALAFVINDAYASSTSKAEQTSIPVRNIAIIFFISLVWLWLAGTGGFFYQSPDHYIRNPIFRDLIFKRWPVVYPKWNDTILCYFIAQWLFPAAIGKISSLFAHSEHVVYLVSRIALLIYSAIGITIVFLIFCKIFKITSTKKMVLASFFLIFFSGCDILGVWLLGGGIGSHIEFWFGPGTFQYMSLTSDLFWIYNSSVIPWIITLLFFYEQRIQNYAYAGVCCLLSGPFPFIGLLPFYFASAISLFFSNKQNKSMFFIKHLLSPQNIVALFVIFPIMASYFFSNMSQTVFHTNTTRWLNYLKDIRLFCKLLAFYIFEFGLYAIILFKQNKKNFIFYTTITVLLCLPFITTAGSGYDFCYKAGVPAILILSILVYSLLITQTQNLKATTLIAIIYSFGILTPLKEFHRAIFSVIASKTIFLNNNEFSSLESIETFGHGASLIMPQYISICDENFLFTKHLMKKNKQRTTSPSPAIINSTGEGGGSSLFELSSNPQLLVRDNKIEVTDSMGKYVNFWGYAIDTKNKTCMTKAYVKIGARVFLCVGSSPRWDIQKETGIDTPFSGYFISIPSKYFFDENGNTIKSITFYTINKEGKQYHHTYSLNFHNTKQNKNQNQ